ncbi:MAG: chalcone isomerase family protein [Sulfuritalea sp.]|nr:chalcone isomerase family protein [Sulfuritalea sp.]
MHKLTVLFLGLVLSAAAGAAEVAGVKLEDKVSLSGTDLVLNGAGVRGNPMMDIYVGALYVPKKQTSLGGVLGVTAPRRVQMSLLIDATADQLAPSFVGGLSKNHSKDEMDAMKPQVEQLVGIIRDIKDVKSGQALFFDFIPGTGTVVSHNGAAKGTIAGDAFNNALLKIWLGEQPASESLKKSMLGG